ncbi:magnesium/cobalt transporter CorA [Roseomonas marmotae]|uniref:Magnesium transport protein CorA n=1 Tax=Roseomonas marmotae TaxID=2768161 RepID=A0ABS3K9S8_9PROT|nr:magnesium/cobalt transporter CorA [Roseomonas marmotae]MBO1073086.1 magnesium/cobalt transporter CorA [Roseomonas marmotae]QTI79273.1 magnesium/cobalt transporter CorA [Roseomonas marmotae]
MLTTYTVAAGRLTLNNAEQPPEALRAAVWIDLLNPLREEVKVIEQTLGLELPTREEMQEIESSSRLYREGEILFLTAPFLYGAEQGEYGSTPITFVLAGHTLLTVRYATPKAFAAFANRAQRNPGLLSSADAVMLHLFEQVVDRLADILERLGADMDRASQSAFRTAKGTTKKKANARDADLKEVLIALGEVGEVTSRARETLLGLTRILTFVNAEKATALRKENKATIKVLERDVRSLVEHASFLSNKANFLLDAVLGIINIDQNGIIKTFTVASVALMPPTLVASIYGMNFAHMPELQSPYGYPLALLLMIGSAVLPILYFKRKGWL